MTAPILPINVKNRLLYYAGLTKPTTWDDDWRGAIMGTINKAIKDKAMQLGFPAPSEARHLLLAWFFVPDLKVKPAMSAVELTPQMINGLNKWLGSWSDGEEWHTRATFALEAVLCLQMAYGELLEVQGQMQFMPDGIDI